MAKLHFGIALLGILSTQNVQAIFGGNEAKLGDFPFMAYFDYVGPYWFQNSAVIVGHKWALTTAESVMLAQNNSNNIQIYSGGLGPKEGSFHQTIKIITHPDYNRATRENNLVLLEVDPPFDFSENVAPIELLRDEIGVNEDVIVTGWQDTTRRLTWVKELTIGKVQCEKFFEDEQYTTILETDVCTVGKLLNENTGFGDQGGPLVTPDRKKLVGIVNFSLYYKPGVYVKMAPYVEWIESILKGQP